MDRNRCREGKSRVPDLALLCTHGKLELPKIDEGLDELRYVRIVDDEFVTEEWNDELGWEKIIGNLLCSF